MIHFAQRSSVYLFLALAAKSFLQLNSSSAPRSKEDLRDAVPGEKISDAEGREVSGSFLRTVFRYPLPPCPSCIDALLYPSDRPGRWWARNRDPADELVPLNARKAGERMVVGQDPLSSALEWIIKLREREIARLLAPEKGETGARWWGGRGSRLKVEISRAIVRSRRRNRS